jgi:hypothetical protein
MLQMVAKHRHNAQRIVGQYGSALSTRHSALIYANRRETTVLNCDDGNQTVTVVP